MLRKIDVPVNRVTGIINAQRSVTADTALRLGHWFGTSPDFWLNLQMLYELRLAQREIGKRVEKFPRRADRKRKDTHQCRSSLRRTGQEFRARDRREEGQPKNL